MPDIRPIRTPHSIRVALLKLVTGLVLLLTLGYSLLVLVYAWVVEDNIFNRLVNEEAAYLQQHYQQSGVVNPPRPAFMQLYQGWQALPETLYQSYLREPMRVEYRLEDGKTVHLQVLQLGGQPYVLLADVGAFEVSRELSPLLASALLLLLLLCLLVVLPVALLLARQITDPVLRLAAAVQDPALPVLAPGFASQFPNNEIGTLAQAIADNQNFLQQALARESHFTKDISHEIRTPLSVLKNLLPHATALSEPERQAFAQAVLTLEQTTETLLALARAESVPQQRFNLTELLEQILLQHYALNHSAAGQRLKLDLQLAEAVWVIANPSLCQMLLQNLLTNLLQYASEPEVGIKLCAAQLVISNSFSLPLPSDPLRSGQRSAASTGIGQGLSLIQRICQVQHWQLQLANDAQKFEITIRFDAISTVV